MLLPHEVEFENLLILRKGDRNYHFLRDLDTTYNKAFSTLMPNKQESYITDHITTLKTVLCGERYTGEIEAKTPD